MSKREYRLRCWHGDAYVVLDTFEVLAMARCPRCEEPAPVYLLTPVGQRPGDSPRYGVDTPDSA